MIFDLAPVEVGLEAHFFQSFEKLGEGFLMSIGHIIDSVVIFIVRVRFVDGVVCEVDE